MMIPANHKLNNGSEALLWVGGGLLCCAFVVYPSLLFALCLLWLGYRYACKKQVQTELHLLQQVKELQQARYQLKQHNTHLQRQALEDPLTGVANRRFFERQARQEWLRAERESRPMALLLCDIDAFKSYNDNLGHQAGDVCLQYVAHVLQKSLKRPGDFVARYGGEEFVIVLPDTDQRGARQVARNIQQALKELALPHPCSQAAEHVTLSIGLAVSEPGDSLDDLIASADQGLYLSKSLGRNRISDEVLQ